MTFDRVHRAEDGHPHSDGVVLDLTDEVGMLVENYVEINPDAVRGLLSALNLAPAERVETKDSAAIYDLAMYRATGSAHLAELFCREFRPAR